MGIDRFGMQALGDRGDNPRVVMPDVRHTDAADEVDERVPVDVGDRRPPCFRGDDWPMR